MNINNTVRPPDNIVADQLVDASDPQMRYEMELFEAMHQSQQEFLSEQMTFQENVIASYNAIYQSREKVFETLLAQLKKVGKRDKDIQFVYDLVEPVIEAYCAQFIETFELDNETHDKVFRLLKSVRVDKGAIEALGRILSVSVNTNPIELF